MDNKVLSVKNLPTKLPVTQSILAFFLLDRFHAPGWAKAIAWTLIGLLWIIGIVLKCKETQVEIAELKR